VTKQSGTVSLVVAVRVRPLLWHTGATVTWSKDILQVMDNMVLVMDPESPRSKDYLDLVQHRSKVWMPMHVRLR
jgi:hypothetical protein